MASRIKIFVEINTSTNALKALIEKNSESLVAPSVVNEISPNMAKALYLARRLKVPQRAQERAIDYAFANKSPIEAWKHRALTVFRPKTVSIR